MTGYRVGPVLEPGETPWPAGWEQDPRIDDGHRHEWESVLLAPGDGRRRMEVVRCTVTIRIAPLLDHILSTHSTLTAAATGAP